MAVKKYFVTVDGEGTAHWYKDAKCKVWHRENGPAVVGSNGYMAWWQNGQRHRVDGPAIVYSDGPKEWYQNGQLHRTDGPAIEHSIGTKEWFQNGQRHRADGPAIEWASGRKDWFINGNRMTEAEFLAATQPVVELTVADIEKLVGKRVKIVK